MLRTLVRGAESVAGVQVVHRFTRNNMGRQGWIKRAPGGGPGVPGQRLETVLHGFSAKLI